VTCFCCLSGGLSKVQVLITGYDVFKQMKYESGIHPIQKTNLISETTSLKRPYFSDKTGWFGWYMVLVYNATFNNISVIL
jgi:hypothetical protein